MAKQYVGGSFAPPLSDQKLAAYRKIIDALPASPVRDAMDALYACCAKWWELPESKGTATRTHAAGMGTEIDLDAGAKTALDPLIPWGHELEAMGRLFDGIDPVAQRDLRNAAFHLLWHAKELDLGREPITTDRL